MLDSRMGLAIQSTLEKGVGSTTLEFKISFVRPITPETGPIKAEGTVISRGHRVGTAEGRVTDGKGRLLVHGTTTCLIFESGSRRKSRRLPNTRAARRTNRARTARPSIRSGLGSS